MFFTVVKKSWNTAHIFPSRFSYRRRKKKKKGKNVSISTLRSTPRTLFIYGETTLGIRADFGFAWSINIIRFDTPTSPSPITGQVLRVTKRGEGEACVNGKNTPLERAIGFDSKRGVRRAVLDTADYSTLRRELQFYSLRK